MNRSSAIETVNSVSIPHRVQPKTIEIDVHGLPRDDVNKAFSMRGRQVDS